MKNCAFCNVTEMDKQWLLYENEHWSVYFADRQDYVGRCIVVARFHRESLSELTTEEWLSLKKIIVATENLLKNEMNATMFNWSCLMNDAYKTEVPHPHVHFHVRPRYKTPISIDNVQIVDTEFSHHYEPKKEMCLNESEINSVFEKLKSKADFYYH